MQKETTRTSLMQNSYGIYCLFSVSTELLSQSMRFILHNRREELNANCHFMNSLEQCTNRQTPQHCSHKIKKKTIEIEANIHWETAFLTIFTKKQYYNLTILTQVCVHLF